MCVFSLVDIRGTGHATLQAERVVSESMDGPARERNQLALIPEDVDDEMDDFEAPLAANAENKQLHKEVGLRVMRSTCITNGQL